MRSLTEQFADWVRTKPAEMPYVFATLKEGDDGCPATQFVETLGLGQYSDKGNRIWMDLHSLPGVLDANPMTFGALADRLASKASTTLLEGGG